MIQFVNICIYKYIILKINVYEIKIKKHKSKDNHETVSILTVSLYSI